MMAGSGGHSPEFHVGVFQASDPVSLSRRAENTSLANFESPHAFALRKRLLVPRWWLEGVLCSGYRQGSKGYGVFEAFAQERLGSRVHSAGAVSQRTLFSLASFWHAVCRQHLHFYSQSQGQSQGLGGVGVSGPHHVTLAMTDLFRGTAQERDEAFAEFRRALMTPLEALEIVRSDRPRTQGQMVLRPTGAVASLIRSLSVEGDEHLRVEFLVPIGEVVTGQALGLVLTFSAPALVTLSPNVLKWHGPHASLRRLTLYLFLELTKFTLLDPSPASAATFLAPLHAPAEWLAFGLTPAQAHDFFGEFLTKAGGLYDHGVLGWSEGLPAERIRDLRAAARLRPNGCVQIIKPSEQTKKVAAFEWEMSRLATLKGSSSLPVEAKSPAVKTLGRPLSYDVESAFVEPTSILPTPPRASAPPMPAPVLPGAAKPRSVPESGERSQPRCGTAANGRGRRRIGGLARFVKLEQSRADSEMEYVLKLAQYYESLSPGQRSELDREMRHRTPADFRAWLGPILERSH